MNEQEIIDHENLTIANEIAWKNYKLEKEKTEKICKELKKFSKKARLTLQGAIKWQLHNTK